MRENEDSSKKQKGRPRSEKSKCAIYSATVALLEENSYLNLTIEAIAARAEVGKMTIYRWWPNKDTLILDVFFEISETQVKFKENSPFRENFLQILSNLARMLNSALGRAVLTIVAQSEPNSEVHQKYYDSFLEPRRNQARKILENAVQCGEIGATVDLDLALDMMFGPFYLRLLMYKEPFNLESNGKLMDYILNGIKTDPLT